MRVEGVYSQAAMITMSTFVQGWRRYLTGKMDVR
jgi:hypothetical protein